MISFPGRMEPKCVLAAEPADAAAGRPRALLCGIRGLRPGVHAGPQPHVAVCMQPNSKITSNYMQDRNLMWRCACSLAQRLTSSTCRTATSCGGMHARSSKTHSKHMQDRNLMWRCACSLAQRPQQRCMKESWALMTGVEHRRDTEGSRRPPLQTPIATCLRRLSWLCSARRCR